MCTLATAYKTDNATYLLGLLRGWNVIKHQVLGRALLECVINLLFLVLFRKAFKRLDDLGLVPWPLTSTQVGPCLVQHCLAHNRCLRNISYMGERTCSELMSCVKGILKDPSGLKNLWKDLSSCDRRPLHSLRKRWVKLMWVPQPGSVAVSTSAPQKMDQILGLSQIVYHSSPTGCLQVGVELRDKDVPWNPGSGQ